MLLQGVYMLKFCYNFHFRVPNTSPAMIGVKFGMEKSTSSSGKCCPCRANNLKLAPCSPHPTKLGVVIGEVSIILHLENVFAYNIQYCS